MLILFNFHVLRKSKVADGIDRDRLVLRRQAFTEKAPASETFQIPPTIAASAAQVSAYISVHSLERVRADVARHTLSVARLSHTRCWDVQEHQSTN